MRLQLSHQLTRSVLRERTKRTQADIARQHAIHPVVLCRLMHGATVGRHMRPRVVALGSSLGLTEAQCFRAVSR